MKLIPLTILLTSLAVDVIAQKFRQEQFPFPPQYHAPGAGVFASDNTLYLPPESHTTIPYFPLNNPNLQFPYLPPTGTKAPAIYPTPFPFVISTTLVPHFEDEEDDDRNHNMIRMSTPMPSKMNITYKAREPSQSVIEKREMRDLRKFQQLPFQQAMDRIDMKIPNVQSIQYPTSTTPKPTSQTPATRRMIISADTEKADLGLDQMKNAKMQGSPFMQKSDVGVDQIKAASLHGSSYFQSPGFYIPPSTTEPAIPILRLSNEMDLDGSFSYEALGADQTHYVQHSRMENTGTDKEEQVVEGSYSYVGDNGQVFTVHYIADANGFRASGDHLPVPPPVPEIIQRAVQYNLAEEAKRPPHLQSWNNDGRDNEIRDSEKSNNFSPPPQRNLFTGRTPEAFSYSYSQGSNTQNNLVAAASNQAPVKTVEYTTEQPKSKSNNGPISPQITFLASQGAHVPSVQDSISRMFTTERPVLPQLVNYEAGVKDSDQEANKGLWRWQYGLNANNLYPHINKETISRSSGEGDDIIINFNDMSPEQYSKLIRSQFESNPDNVAPQYDSRQQMNNNQNNYVDNNYYRNEQANIQRAMDSPNANSYTMTPETQPPSTEKVQVEQSTLSQLDDWFKQNYNQIPQFPTTVKPIESRDPRPATARLITHKDFLTPTVPSQIVTQSYNFEETFYEPRKLRTLSTDSNSENYQTKVNYFESERTEEPVKTVPEKSISTSNPWTNIINSNEIKTTTTQPQYASSVNGFKFSDFIVQDRKNDFKPVTTTTTETPLPKETTTTLSPEDIIENNMFLKNILKFQKPKRETEEVKQEIKSSQIEHEPKMLETRSDNKTPEISNEYKVSDEPKKVIYNILENQNKEAHTNVEAKQKTDKVTKLIPIYHSKPTNEIKIFKKKPIDIAEIMNYVSMKNQFESNKMKPKSKSVNNMNDNRNEVRFIPIQQDNNEGVMNVPEQKPVNNVRTFNFEEPKINSFKGINFEQEPKPINVKPLFKPEENSNFRTLNYDQEVRGNIKNYKVLNRNNNNNMHKYDSNIELKTELSPPPLKSPSLPPLGRAGPSMKSYLPPIYV